MTPFALLKIPEYGRFFDGAPLGFIYRFLRTGIRRQVRSELAFRNPTGWVTEQARLYEQGWLVSYTTLDKLADASGFTVKSIRSHLSKLEELKLIKTQKFGDGILVLLGKRLLFKSSEGLSVGDAHEGFFIDEWYTLAETNAKEFRKMLINSLAPKMQAERFLERLEEEFSEEGKIFPEPEKNFSQNPEEKSDENPRPAQAGVASENSPRIDKVRIEEKEHTPPAGEVSSNPFEDTLADTRSVMRAIGNSPDYKDALELARDSLANNIPLSVVNQALTSRLDNPRFPSFPRFSVALSEAEEDPKNPHMTLGFLWAALHEDITGVASSKEKKFYQEVVGVYKRSLLKEYSYQQCRWTLIRVAHTGDSLDFLMQGGRNLLAVVRSFSKTYQELLDEQHRSRLESAAEEARIREQEELSKVRESKPAAEITPEHQERIDRMNKLYEDHKERKRKVRSYLVGAS